MAYSIAVKDSDVYLAGQYLNGPGLTGNPVILFWKNGTEIPVEDPSNEGGWTNSVFISKNNGQNY